MSAESIHMYGKISGQVRLESLAISLIVFSTQTRYLAVAAIFKNLAKFCNCKKHERMNSFQKIRVFFRGLLDMNRFLALSLQKPYCFKECVNLFCSDETFQTTNFFNNLQRKVHLTFHQTFFG